MAAGNDSTFHVIVPSLMRYLRQAYTNSSLFAYDRIVRKKKYEYIPIIDYPLLHLLRGRFLVVLCRLSVTDTPKASRAMNG